MHILKRIETIFEKSGGAHPWLLSSKTFQRFFHLYQSFEIYYKNYKHRAIFKKILKTPRFHCNPEAETEIHTLTSHGHVFMYMTAIKSFLRFCDNVAVVAHDGREGSLTEEDKILLREHINGIRIIDYIPADEEADRILSPFPKSKKYRENFINSMELFDHSLFSRRNKIIIMNSDVLFLKEPKELMHWIHTDQNEIITIYEGKPCDQKKFLNEWGCDFPPHVCLAVACFYRQIFDPYLIERILDKIVPDFCTGQNIYPLLIHHKSREYKFSFLDKDTYQASRIFTDGAVCRHYQSSVYLDLFKQHTQDSKRIIDELTSKRSR